MRACTSGEVIGSGISQSRQRHVRGVLPPGCRANIIGFWHFGQRLNDPAMGCIPFVEPFIFRYVLSKSR